ncbi:GDP-L-fucose synthase, partial [Terribacillus saccharophilus]|nr:GDP-L-fucose synthase [Terribacillus saccharophilus]
EFLYSEDLADACVYLMINYTDNQFVNIGVGKDITIKELALKIKNLVGYQGELTFDSSKPDGTPRKLVDVTKLNGIGWSAKTSLDEGLSKTYKWFKENELTTTNK